MADTDGSEEYTTLGEFLEEYYKQFAIMGIFGTVSVFLSDNFPGGEETLSARAAIFASLSIFALIAAWLCLRTLGELIHSVNDATRHLSTDIGFVVIILSTATLTGAIIDAILTYSDIIEIAQVVIISSVGLLVYIRNFPTSRYYIFESKPELIPYWSFVPILPMFDPLFRYSYILYYRAMQADIPAYVLMTITFLSIHLTICEAVLGAYQVKSSIRIEDPIHQIKSSLLDPNKYKSLSLSWTFPMSVLIGGVGLAIHSIGLAEISEQYTSAILIFGYNWAVIVLISGISFAILVAAIIWNWRTVEDIPEYIENLAQYICPLLLTMSIIIVISVNYGIIGEPRWGY